MSRAWRASAMWQLRCTASIRGAMPGIMSCAACATERRRRPGRSRRTAARRVRRIVRGQQHQLLHVGRRHFRVEHLLQALQAAALDLHHHGVRQDALRAGELQREGRLLAQQADSWPQSARASGEVQAISLALGQRMAGGQFADRAAGQQRLLEDAGQPVDSPRAERKASSSIAAGQATSRPR